MDLTNKGKKAAFLNNLYDKYKLSLKLQELKEKKEEEGRKLKRVFSASTHRGQSNKLS